MCLSADGAKTCQIVTPPATQVTLGEKCPALVFPNAEGAGYYRFGGSQDDWSKWIGAASTLDAADQFTLFHNVDAAMRGGYGTATDYFDTIKTLAPVARWDLLESDHHSSFNISDSLHDLRVTGVIAPADVSKVQAFVRAKFGPRLAPLGLAARPNEKPAEALMRQYLVQLLVEEGDDPALIAQLSKAADTYLASNGANNAGIAPELLQEALRAGVMSEGAPFVDRVLAAMQKSQDEFFIQSAIYAVAGASDEASLRKLLDLTLTPAIRIGDMRYVFRYMENEARGRDVAWVWFKQNYDALLKRLSSYGMASAPDILSLGCDDKTKAELTAFFGPRTAQLTGTPRTLKENEDRISRCIAFKQAKGAEIATAIGALR
jgi:alanyl aminopeptidase